MADILGSYEPTKKYGGAGQPAQGRPKTFAELQKEGVARPGINQVQQPQQVPGMPQVGMAPRTAFKRASDTTVTPPASGGSAPPTSPRTVRDSWNDPEWKKRMLDYANKYRGIWSGELGNTQASLDLQNDYWSEANKSARDEWDQSGIQWHSPGKLPAQYAGSASWDNPRYTNDIGKFYLTADFRRDGGGVEQLTDEFDPDAYLAQLAERQTAQNARADEYNKNLEAQSQNPQQSQQSLWQSIMGYYPNIPQEYGWENGWDGYSSGMQNWMNQNLPQQGTQTPSAGIDSPFLNAATAGGQSKAVGDPNTPESFYQLNPALRKMGASASSYTDADQGDGNPGWPNNGPEWPNGEGGTYGGSPTGTGGNTPPPDTGTSTPPATTPPTYTPPTNPPYNPGNSGLDDRMTNWGTSFSPYQSPISAQMMQALLGYLKNPNSYNSDLVVGSYNRLNNLLTEQGDVERQQIGEEMARRGIGDSTIHGGRLGDVAIEQSRARSDLAHQLLSDAAQQEGSSMSNALGLGLGYDQNAQSAWSMNENAQRGRMQDMTNYDQQRFMQWLQQFYANNQGQNDYWDFILRQLGL